MIPIRLKLEMALNPFLALPYYAALLSLWRMLARYRLCADKNLDEERFSL